MPSSNIVIILVAVVEHHCLLTGVAMDNIYTRWIENAGSIRISLQILIKQSL